MHICVSRKESIIHHWNQQVWRCYLFIYQTPIVSIVEHCGDVIMGARASQITSLTLVYSTVKSGEDQRKFESSAFLAFVRGIHRGPVNSSHKAQWRGALMFSLICARINSRVNNRQAGDLRRHHAHYDVIVMFMYNFFRYSKIFRSHHNLV